MKSFYLRQQRNRPGLVKIWWLRISFVHDAGLVHYVITSDIYPSLLQLTLHLQVHLLILLYNCVHGLFSFGKIRFHRAIRFLLVLGPVFA